MKNHSKLFIAAAAAFVLSSPVFAQQHDASTCPHHQATETAVSQALTLLDQARAENGEQAKATTEQARQQLAGAQKHMAACEEMCEAKMDQGHEGHGGHAMHQGHAGHEAASAGQVQKQQVVDPVCGMEVDPKTAEAKSVYAGKTYYFCSKDDKVKFDGDPEKYLKKG